MARFREAEDPLEPLLREGGWVRRLAGGLLGDPAAADDLTQDVLAAALARGPALQGASLRAWLRTVARRLAGRDRERARSRAAAELRRARAEAVDDDALAHAELHRRLAAAILALEPPLRTAVVLRYLEELPPHAIAARLGLTETAARKRVSRGLARLRETLDAEERPDRASWAVAAATLARGRVEAAPAPPCDPAGLATSSLPQASLLALMTSKIALLLALTAAGTAVVLLVQREARGPEPDDPPVAAALPADRGLAPASAGAVDAAGAPAAGEPSARTAVASPAAAAPPAAPRLRVVDAQGAPVAGAVAAWLDAARDVHPVELDLEASAPLPERAEGALLYAGAGGYANAWLREPEGSGDAVLVLERAVETRGRIVEDGGPPVRPFDLLVHHELVGPDLGYPASREVSAALRDAGFRLGTERARVASDGSFSIQGFRSGETVTVTLPLSHSVLPDALEPPAISRFATLTAGPPQAIVRTTRLPSVRGRLVWEDDGAPVAGDLLAIYRGFRGESAWFTTAVDRDGRFEIGIPIPAEDLRLPPGERTRLLQAGLVIQASGDGERRSPGLEHEVTFDAGDLPLDLGVLRVPPARALAVRVLGPGGAPVAGAAVASGLGSWTTGADGVARVEAKPADALEVLAYGFAYARVPVPDGEELEVELAPGTSLVVHAGAGAGGLAVGIAWDRTPFEGGDGQHGGIPWRVHARLAGGLSVGRTRATYPLPSEGDLEIAGLVPGAALTVALLDALGEPVLERAVVLPEAPGRLAIELALAGVATLRARLVDEAGRPVPEGRIELQRAGGKGLGWFPFSDGAVEIERLLAAEYRVVARAPGYVPLEREAYVLRPEAPPLELALQRARSLHVRVVDDAGRVLVPRSVALESEGGWTERLEPGDDVRSVVVAPLVPLTLEASVGTRTYRAEVEALAEDALVHVPRHARVRIELAAVPELATEDGEIRGRVREARGEGALDLWTSFRPDAAGPLSFAIDLLPGLYDLELDLEEWSGIGEENDLIRPLARLRFEVEGDATVVVPIAR